MTSIQAAETGTARPVSSRSRGIWGMLFGKASEHPATDVQTSRELPDQFQDCRTYNEKVAWINSPRGQQILQKRPVLREYHANGRLLRMIQNKHWDQRLNEWLFIHREESPVPLGLGIDIPEELKPDERGNLVIHTDNPPIEIMFRDHPAFLSKMTFPTSAKYDFLTDGYATFRNIIPLDVIESANAAISRMIVESEEFKVSTAERQRNPKRGVDPFFSTGGTNDRNVLALYYCSPICALVESILHNEVWGPESVRNGQFRARAHHAQVAFRFSQARPASAMGGFWGGRPTGADGQPKIGGRSWHLDGMDKGQYGPFSLLVGVALSDQTVDNCGNLGVHSGSHYTLQPFLKKYAAACDHSDINTSDPQAVQERRLYAVSLVQNKPVLDEPVQVKLAKGDVVFALHKLAHLGTPNYSDNIRKMVYFRVSHRNLQKIRGPALKDLWIEYEGMGEVLL